jgi:hypothetical protein
MTPALQLDRRALLARASAVAAATLELVLSGCGERPRVSITVAGKHEQVPAGTTLAEAVALFQLRPAAGSLLDVHGRILRRGVFPGSVLLDGRRATKSCPSAAVR